MSAPAAASPALPTRAGRGLPLVRIAVRQYRWVALVLLLPAAYVCAAILHHYASWADALALRDHVGSQAYHFGRYTDDAHQVTGRLVDDGSSLAFRPALLAALVTAVLTAREWETRRVVLALTQSVTPRRWFTVRWAVQAAFLAAVTVPGVALYRISAVHGFRLGLLTYGAERQNAYYTIGPVTVAHVLLGVAAGALCGTLLRRTLPALVAAPVLTWLVAGAVVRSRAVLLVDFPLFSKVHGFHPGGVAGLQFYDALPQDSYLMNALEPGDYWGFQIASSALVLAAAALLAVAALRVLRRRTAQY
ncbi:hypothetical protein [Streptomyces sp. NBC_00102]|uniref:hypothetical protein n=1 Tax=Streptomyces sp. NBC_00102 TaxID=2975652 RepID=UPI00224CBC75|nr:hypothetical protein [Streptomyces sp. NBC_00102]MCX5399344.1 hypothetical protein [Streptomyces sp. NBC_00102]